MINVRNSKINAGLTLLLLLDFKFSVISLMAAPQLYRNNDMRAWLLHRCPALFLNICNLSVIARPHSLFTHPSSFTTMKAILLDNGGGTKKKKRILQAISRQYNNTDLSCDASFSLNRLTVYNVLEIYRLIIIQFRILGKIVLLKFLLP